MTEPVRRTRGVQQGPRSAQVLDSVRAAVRSELERVGFAELTIDGVARSAGVNRTTIYRRWPSKVALLAMVVEPLLQRYDQVPDTGAVHADLLAVMQLIRDNSVRPEGRALIEAASARADDLADLIRRANERTLVPFRAVLARALERGELGPEHDVGTIAYLAFQGVVMWPTTHDSQPTDDDFARILAVLLPSVPDRRPA